MSDRYIAFTVILEKEIKNEDAECIINAIKMIKCVRDVTPIVADPSTYFAQINARTEIAEQIMKVLYPNLYKDKK